MTTTASTPADSLGQDISAGSRTSVNEVLYGSHSDRETLTVRAAGHDLRVTVDGHGRGTPLLLINGIGATGDLFDPLREHLADRETIAFDAPGVGGSPAPSIPRSMAQLAGMVAGLARALGHQQIDVLGISWGGALAQEVARRHPHLVRRLVLAATTPGWWGVMGRPAAMALLMSPARYRSPAYLRQIAPTLYGGDIADHPDLLENHARQRHRLAPSDRGYWYQLYAIQTWVNNPWWLRIMAPTLILAGDDDPIIPIGNGRLLADTIPDSTLHIVEGGGHLFLFVRAHEMAERIRLFADVDAVTQS